MGDEISGLYSFFLLFLALSWRDGDAAASARPLIRFIIFLAAE